MATENEVSSFLDRFASTEAKHVLRATPWFICAMVVGIAVEIVVSYLEDFPKLHFVTWILALLGKFILVCDAVVFALFALVAALLACDSLLKQVGVDAVAICRWVGQKKIPGGRIMVWAMVPCIALIGVGALVWWSRHQSSYATPTPTLTATSMLVDPITAGR
jgi:hypothetical protein